MSMQQVTIAQAQKNLASLVDRALAGEEVIIARDANRRIRLEALPASSEPRRIGGAKGLIRCMADDFDACLDDFRPYKE